MYPLNSAGVPPCSYSPPSRSPAPRPLNDPRLLAARDAAVHSANDPSTTVRLANVLITLGQESGDARYFREGEAVVLGVLKANPKDFEARRAVIQVSLGLHDDEKALAAATRLNKEVPDDVLTYGLMADADMALGRYDEAERSIQWMLDLRPTDADGLCRAAALREVYGDRDGALDLLSDLLRRTGPSDATRRAALLTRIAALRLADGEVAAATENCDAAIEAIPDYPAALAVKARACGLHGDWSAAADLLRRRLDACPTPARSYDLAEALAAARQPAEADRLFMAFVADAMGRVDAIDNANPQLIRCLLRSPGQAAAALRVARREASVRKDVVTLGLYAQALHASGDENGAQTQIEAALAITKNDPELLFVAGTIDLARSDRKAALDHFMRAAQQERGSDFGRRAREAVESMAPPVK